jgi:hypothetical protein
VPLEKFKHKIKWVNKYISRPLIILVILFLIASRLSPKFNAYIGIDLKTLGKYTFYFFLVKGLMWCVVFAYGFIQMRNKIKSKK